MRGETREGMMMVMVGRGGRQGRKGGRARAARVQVGQVGRVAVRVLGRRGAPGPATATLHRLEARDAGAGQAHL